MNVADWAESVGVNRRTVYRRFREGTLPVRAERAGRLILVRTAMARQVVVVVVDPVDRTDDLVRDISEVRASVCARLSGRRGAWRRAMRALTATTLGPGA